MADETTTGERRMSTDEAGDANDADHNHDETTEQDGETAGDATGKSSKNARHPYKQKYKPAWELDSGLKEWLTACRTDPYAAFCRICKTKLHAHKKGLLAHAKSAKHKKHLSNYNYNSIPLSTYDNLNESRLTNGNNSDFLDDPLRAHSSSGKKNYRIFNDSLLKDPQFSDWLRKVPTNSTKALCIACRCVISAGRCELLKHTKAAKHQRAMTEGPFEEVNEHELQWLDSSTNPDNDRDLVLMETQAIQPMIDMPGMLVDEVLSRLEKHVPLELAEKWDNVGIITRPTLATKIHNVLLTINLTEKIVMEAINKRVQLILSYHPPIFNPMKSLNPNRWKDKAILMCIEHKITVYSPHTALDAIKGGINDWLISSFMTCDEDKVTPIIYSHNKQNSFCLEVLLSEPQETVTQTFKDIHNVTMTDYGNSSTDVRVTCNEKTLPEVVEHLARNNCAQVYSMVTQLAPEPIPGVGMGRVVTLANSLPLYEVIQRTKTHLDLTYIRLALSPKHTRDTKVNAIAVCAGSGSTVLKGCKADVWITGEMSHHEVLDTINNGITVILCEHSNTERGFLRDWSQQLKTSVLDDQVMVQVSEIDRDPLRIV